MSRPSNAKISARLIATATALAVSFAFYPATDNAAADSTPATQTESAPLDKVVKGMWTNVKSGWEDRLIQDPTQVVCSKFHNNPPAAEAEEIVKREAATIKLPADGNVIGNWQEGEKIASNGRGGQFSDPPDTKNGGNCYACHQLAKNEVSFGTLGPSLTNYGKDREFSAEAAKEAFSKIYNAQSTVACSNMPRFGAHKFLTEQQIKDVVGFLFDKESPVNK